MDKEVNEFLYYWEHNKPTDAANVLYRAYRSNAEALAKAKARTYEFLVPVNTGKAWHVDFDSSRIDEVAQLGNDIKNFEAKNKSICEDIKAFCEAVGNFTLSSLAAQRTATHNRLSEAELALKNLVRTMTNLRYDLLPAQILQLPEIVAQTHYLEDLRKETENKLAEIGPKIEAGDKILAKYR